MSIALPSYRSHWLSKWFAFYKVYFSDALVYRANAVIWLLTDTFPAIIMPLLWLASYHGRSQIRGFTPSQMVVYYMVVLFLSCVVESHIMWDIYTSVKDGSFNIFLARPFSYMGTMYATNVSWRLMRTLLFIPLFAIVLALFHRWTHWDPSAYNMGWQFWLAVVLGHFVSFFLTYCMGLIAVYVVEAQSIFNFYYLPLVLFNGQIAPLSFFPHGIANCAAVLPFAYTMSFPAQIFIGHVQGRALWEGYGVQMAWIVIAFVAGRIMYRQGVKQYNSVGI